MYRDQFASTNSSNVSSLIPSISAIMSNISNINPSIRAGLLWSLSRSIRSTLIAPTSLAKFFDRSLTIFEKEKNRFECSTQNKGNQLSTISRCEMVRTFLEYLGTLGTSTERMQTHGSPFPSELVSQFQLSKRIDDRLRALNRVAADCASMLDREVDLRL